MGLLTAAQFTAAPSAVMLALGSLLGLVVIVSRERQARLSERRDAHDTLGHLAGDETLRAVAERLRDATCSPDEAMYADKRARPR